MRNAKITHVLSVLEYLPENAVLSDYKHLHVPLDDMEEVNLIECFPRTNNFIQHALDGGRLGGTQAGEGEACKPGGVLVHCYMGISRSATMILAYLLWASNRRFRDAPKASIKAEISRSDATSHEADSDAKEPDPGHPLTPQEALALLRQGRPIASPNRGFLAQLELYHQMGCPDDVEGHPQYQRWLYQNKLQDMRRAEIAPEVDYIRFEDESAVEDSENKGKDKPHIEIKCRRCRRLLAQSAFLVDHEPAATPSQQTVPTECAHIFVHPLSWMKPMLSDGSLDGRLTCPGTNCQANVGKFAWQGLQCSCGKWETPGFGFARSKVDQSLVGKKGEPISGTLDGKALTLPNVRLPPGMKENGDTS